MSRALSIVLPSRLAGATRRPPSRLRASSSHWERHVASGEQISRLLLLIEEEATALRPTNASLVAYIRELHDEIASADRAAWRAIHALEAESARQATRGAFAHG